ncbi:MAG: right-handed parallel beta-helix repeat-containing protein [Bacteroidota bacterium]
MKSMNTIYSLLLTAFILMLSGVYLCNAQDTTSDSQSESVHDFGAKGDSITDDTEAIQRAVDSGDGQLVFPSGTYRVTKPIDIDLDKVGPVVLEGHGTARILMEGAGPAFKFVGTHKGTANPSTVKQNVWQSQRMPLIDGLEIVGRHPEAVGIEAVGTMQLTITRVLVRKALHGIHLTERNRNVIISECHFYQNRGIGVYLDEVNLHQINITNSHISYNAGGGIVVRKGDVRNLQVGSCDIESNMEEDGPITANILIDITEGSMREGAITGCTIQHSGDAPESANIRFIGHGTQERRKTGNFTIANNALSDAQYNLHIQYGRGIIITGNTFWKGFSHNILIQQSDHINLGSNTLDRNPDYGSGNTEESQNGVKILESRHLTINGLHINHVIGGPAGIVLEQCRNYNLTNSTILNCEEGGILLKETENGKVSGNFINDDRQNVNDPVAIKVKGGKNNLIISNHTKGIIDGEPDAARIIDNYSF